MPHLAIPCNEVAKIDPIITSNSILRGYVVQSSSLDDETVNLLHPVGEILVARSYSRSEFNFPRRVSNLAISHEEGNLGICIQRMDKNSLECTRFGFEGEMTLEFSVQIKSPDVGRLKIRNHKDGGIILLLGYAQNKKKVKLFDELDVMRIDNEGNVRGYHSKRWVDCPRNESITDLDIFQRNGYDFCYYVSCTLPKRISPEVYHLKIFEECFSDDRA